MVAYVAPPVFVTWVPLGNGMETPMLMFCLTFKRFSSGWSRRAVRDAIPGGSGADFIGLATWASVGSIHQVRGPHAWCPACK